jgi:hypothetical protein
MRELHKFTGVGGLFRRGSLQIIKILVVFSALEDK